MSRAFGFDRVPLGLPRLRQPGQRVELADDADHRRAAAPFGGERRRNLGHPDLHPEAGAPQLFLEQRAALLLLVAELGKRPDLQGDVSVAARVCIDRGEHGLRIETRLRLHG